MQTLTVQQADISDAKFGKTMLTRNHPCAGARSARTWFKKFLRLWPEFRLSPSFKVLGDGQLEFCCDGGCVRLNQSFLFGDAEPIRPGSIVRVELS